MIQSKTLANYKITGPMRTRAGESIGIKAEGFMIDVLKTMHYSYYVCRFSCVDDMNLYKLIDPAWKEIFDFIIIGKLGTDLSLDDITGLGL